MKYLAYISNLFSLKGSDLIFHRALCDKLPSKYRDQDISFLITAASSKIEAHSLSFPAACFSIFSYLQGDSQSAQSSRASRVPCGFTDKTRPPHHSTASQLPPPFSHTYIPGTCLVELPKNLREVTVTFFANQTTCHLSSLLTSVPILRLFNLFTHPFRLWT